MKFFAIGLALLPVLLSHVAVTLAFLPIVRVSKVVPVGLGRLANASDSDNNNKDMGIDTLVDDRLYRVRLSRAVGIEWGTDLSFSFVYVRALDPSGAAAASKQVKVGDQLCELRPVNIVADNRSFVNLIGAPFDTVMTLFADLDKSVREVDLVFFRGTKNELKGLVRNGAPAELESITVTVIQQKGRPEESITTLTAPAGVNLRKLLVDNGINVYQSVTRWTNCKGKQLCGTCIVDVRQGLQNTNRKSIDESSTLRENPESYRLSCVTFAYEDITVETFPPVSASQWTR